MNEHKELLQKWIKILLYGQIASMAITVINALTYLDNITAWLLRAVNVAMLWSLIQIRVVTPRYQKAAIAKIIVLICSVLTAFVNPSGIAAASILALVGSTAAWVGSYQEYHGHGEMVADADRKLAKRWNDLFVWEIVIAVVISMVSVGLTTVLVAAGGASSNITTVVILLSTLLNLVLEALYLLYIKRTLALLNA